MVASLPALLVIPGTSRCERTRSPGWTALTYAATYLPWLAGGLVLAGIADRFPRRTVLVTCDLASCCLVAVMALPGMPLPAMVALLFLVTLLQAPFTASRSATYADILPADRYPAGVATAASTAQLAAVTGFVCGGVFVAALGARPALAADAATFATSAAFVWLGVRARPAAAASARGRRPVITGIVPASACRNASGARNAPCTSAAQQSGSRHSSAI